MSSFQEQYADYMSGPSSSNKMLQLIGVPAIIIGLLMLTNWISIDISTKLQISFAWILIIVSCVYYFMLNLKLAAIATVFLFVLTFIVTFIAGPTPSFGKLIFALILIGAGIGLLYVGGALAKAKAAIQKNLLMIALIPLFFIYDLIEISGFKSALFKE